MENKKTDSPKSVDAKTKPMDKLMETIREKPDEKVGVFQDKGGGDKKGGIDKDRRVEIKPPPPVLNYPLPCPFCGSDLIRVLTGYQFYRYYCNDCEAHSKACPDPESALKGWNRRV